MENKIVLYKRSASKNWQFYYYVGGKRIQKSTPYPATKSNYAQAALWANDFIAAKKKDTPQTTFRTLIESMFAKDSAWLKARALRGKPIRWDIARGNLYAVRAHFLDRFGDVPIGSVKPWMIEDHVIAENCSPSVKNRVFYVVRCAYKEAARMEIIDTIPLIENVKTVHAKRKAFSMEQLEKMFCTDPLEMKRIWRKPEYYIFFALLGATGLRRGEALALTTDDILDNGVILVTKALKEHVGVGKTKARKDRVALITEQMVDYIRRYVIKRDGSLHGQRIFCRYWSSYSIHFRLAMKALGFEGFVPHCLRHTYNTDLARVEADDRITEKAKLLLLGHESEKTNKIYTHLTIEDLSKDVIAYRDVSEVGSILADKVGSIV